MAVDAVFGDGLSSRRPEHGLKGKMIYIIAGSRGFLALNYQF
jgi:hypothetical protein